MSKRSAARAWLLLLLLPLAACGYSLRGSDVISAQFDSLALDLDQPNSEFSRLLRRSLDVADVENLLTTEARSSDAILSVRNERVVSRPVTVNPRARAAQHEMRMSVDIMLLQDSVVLIDAETLMVERIYFEDIANIAGNQEEREIIAAEMRRDLVNQLMRR